MNLLKRFPWWIYAVAALFACGLIGSVVRGPAAPGFAPTSTPQRAAFSNPTPTTPPRLAPAVRTPSPTRQVSQSRSTNAPKEAAGSALVEAVVVRVVDGDTLIVRIGGSEQSVRIIGVDTPETVHPQEPVQCFGREASDRTQALVELASGMILLEKDVSEKDRYDRLLRYVWLLHADGRRMLNEELVKGGYAQVSTYPPDVKYQEVFLAAEREARAENRGLWGACGTFGAPAITSTLVPADTATLAPTPSSTVTPFPTLTPVTAAPETATTMPAPPPPPVEAETATAMPASPTPAISEPPISTGGVRIATIFYDGVEPRTEGDEYAVIENPGDASVNLLGYRLSAGNPGQDFTFPSFMLQPGATVRVYTNRNIDGSFSFGKGRAIWNNQGDCGYLYAPGGALVSEYCY